MYWLALLLLALKSLHFESLSFYWPAWLRLFPYVSVSSCLQPNVLVVSLFCLLLPCVAIDQGWRNFWRAFAQIVNNFEEVISCAHGNFEEQTNGMEPSIIIIIIIIITYCFIISYYNFNVQRMYSTGCPTRYRTRNFFNNSTTNEDIATKFVWEMWLHHNVLLFKFRSNIFIGVRIFKEMPGSVASGTPCIMIIFLIKSWSRNAIRKKMWQ